MKNFKFSLTLIICFAIRSVTAVGQDNVQSDTISAGKTGGEIWKTEFNVEKAQFSSGHIYNIHQLIRGQIPGMLFSRVGDDPNNPFELRHRGLHTLLGNSQPLHTINGIKYVDVRTLEPLDVLSVSVPISSSQISATGLGSNQGIIEFTTFDSSAPRGLYINMGFTSSSNRRRFSILDRGEYLSAKVPERNLDSDTDWWDEVTRNGLSHFQYISFRDSLKSLNYKLSASNRNVQGIGEKTGFDRQYTSLFASQSLFNRRLKWSGFGSYSSQIANFGNYDVFKHAQIYNPTAPVTGMDQHNPPQESTGGYYQNQFFDYFNPVAILEQGSNKEKRNYFIGGLNLEWNPLWELLFYLNGSYQNSNILFGEQYPEDSYYRSNTFFGLSNETITKSFSTSAGYEISFGKWMVRPQIRYEYISFDLNRRGGSIAQISMPFLDFHQIDLLLNTTEFSNPGLKEKHKQVAFRGSIHAELDKKFYILGSLSREGSSRFAPGQQWRSFGGVDFGINLMSLFDHRAKSAILFQAGYGISGNDVFAPDLFHPAFQQQGFESYFPGINSIFVDRIGNPELRSELTKEWYSLISFQPAGRRHIFTFNTYWKLTEDLVFNIFVPSPPNLGRSIFVNLDDVQLSGAGFDFEWSYNSKIGNITWRSNSVLSIYKTRVNNLAGFSNPGNYQLLNERGEYVDGSFGRGNFSFVTFREGTAVGQLYGFQYQGLSGGSSIIADVDNDGILGDLDDMALLGSAYPSVSLGWRNRFEKDNFVITLAFRGDFGHKIASVARLHYELEDQTVEFNSIQTKLAEVFYFIQPFSSHFVENGSYITLDEFSFGYKFYKSNRSWELNAHFNNLFYLSSYSGPDPTIRLSDRGSSTNGSRPRYELQPSVFGAGLDRTQRYPIESSFTLSASLSL